MKKYANPYLDAEVHLFYYCKTRGADSKKIIKFYRIRPSTLHVTYIFLTQWYLYKHLLSPIKNRFGFYQFNLTICCVNLEKPIQIKHRQVFSRNMYVNPFPVDWHLKGLAIIVAERMNPMKYSLCFQFVVSLDRISQYLRKKRTFPLYRKNRVLLEVNRAKRDQE